MLDSLAYSCGMRVFNINIAVNKIYKGLISNRTIGFEVKPTSWHTNVPINAFIAKHLSY